MPFAIARQPALRPATPSPTRDLIPVPMADVVYAKVFLAAPDVDQFLTDHCGPLMATLRSRNLVRGWFYIRYDEHGHHVRLRVFVADAQAHAAVVRALVELLDQLQQQEMVRRVGFDRYEREIVRYGGAALMPISEKMFEFDSDIALATLAGADTDEQRWRLALWSCNALLEDAGLAIADRHRVAQKLAGNFRSEYRVGRRQRELLGKEYRRHAAHLLAMVDREHAQPAWLLALNTATQALRLARRTQIAAARVAWSADVAARFDATLGSHLHMTCNRLFSAHARAYEVLVYDALERSYRAATGRSRALQARAA